MELIEQLKQERMESLRSGDKVKQNLLSSVISEATRNNKTPGDEEVEGTIKKMSKSIEETKSSLESVGRSTEQATEELKILNNYIPEEMTNDEIENEVDKILSSLESPNMGDIMKQLKQYGSKIDMKSAKEIVQRKLKS